MKKNLNDPNNHVPEISDDGNWDEADDYEQFTDTVQGALPTGRSENKMLPKKEVKTVIGSEIQSSGFQAELDDHEEAVARIMPELEGEVEEESSKHSNDQAIAKKELGKQPKTELPTASVRRNTQVVNEIGTGKSSRVNRRPEFRIKPKQNDDEKPELIPETEEEKIERMRNRFVRGERSDWGVKKANKSEKWMIYPAVGIVVLILLTIIWSQSNSTKEPSDSSNSKFGSLQSVEAEGSDSAGSLSLLETMTNKQELVSELYAQYITATSLDDFSDILFNAEEILPLLQQSWEPTGYPVDWVPDESALWTVFEQDEKHYGVLEGRNPDFTAFAVVFQTDGTDLKMDWKASSGYCSTDFNELKAGNGDASEVRTIISLADFYTFALPDEKYQAYRLMSPDGETVLWGYVELDSPVFASLQEIMIPSQITGDSLDEARVMVKMERGSEDTLPNQWVITDIIRMNWLDIKVNEHSE